MVVMMDLDQNLFPQQQALVFHSVSFDTVVINDYHHLLRGEGGGVFIKELHNSHVGHARNGSICIYHEQKTSA